MIFVFRSFLFVNFCRFFTFGILLFIFSDLLCQTHPPKREFRGAWIASIKNIDWPSNKDLSTEEQQTELRDLLDKCVEAGLNAVVFQIRPTGEVFYNSPFEPWSEYLTGKVGRAPSPYYDPLTFAIKEAHSRGLELHAWINPFRLHMDWKLGKDLPADHIAIKTPEWTIAYGKNLYLDPGLPQTRKYLTQVILDIVKRYQIDAIHFDDYFYPYKIQGESFNDSLSFDRYNSRNLSLDEWRRSNINTFIKTISDSIYEANSYVELGISPFGVWRNKSQDPMGSSTRSGQTSYDDLYADILYWIREGWIDYVVPQLYWSQGYSPADFRHLVDWWAEHSGGSKLYIGHALYKIDNNVDPNWENPREIPEQIKLLRRYKSVSGSVFFSARWLKTNPLGVFDSLRNNHYYYPSLTPPMTRADYQLPLSPINLELDSDPEGIAMIWNDRGLEGEVKYYVVYRNKGDKAPLPLPEFQLTIIRSEDLFFLDEKTRFFRKYTYGVTAVNWRGNESDMSAYRSQRRWSGLFRKKEKEKATLGGK